MLVSEYWAYKSKHCRIKREPPRIYYQNKSKTITLYKGDCIDLRINCDLLLTDPPYGINYVAWNKNWGGLVNDTRPELVIQRLQHVLKNLKRSRHVYIFPGELDLTPLNLAGKVDLIWDKELKSIKNLHLPWGPAHETILFGVHGLVTNGKLQGAGNLTARLRKGSVLREQRPSGKQARHPTEKPIGILRQMIESSSMLGEIVYDPFCGSASTLVAAAKEDRIAIGCEVDERYCEIAAERLFKECS